MDYGKYFVIAGISFAAYAIIAAAGGLQ